MGSENLDFLKKYPMKVFIFLLIPFVFSKIIVTTWNFQVATKEGYKQLEIGKPAIDAIEQGCSTCEKYQCDGL